MLDARTASCQFCFFFLRHSQQVSSAEIVSLIMTVFGLRTYVMPSLLISSQRFRKRYCEGFSIRFLSSDIIMHQMERKKSATFRTTRIRLLCQKVNQSCKYNCIYIVTCIYNFLFYKKKKLRRKQLNRKFSINRPLVSSNFSFSLYFSICLSYAFQAGSITEFYPICI